MNFCNIYKEKFSNFEICLKEQELCYEGKIYRLDILLLNANEAIIIDYKSSYLAAINSHDQMIEYAKAISNIYIKSNIKAYFAVLKKKECQMIECKLA